MRTPPFPLVSSRFPVPQFGFIIYLATATVFTICHLTVGAAEKGAAAKTVFRSTPLVIAHRGASKTHPENTLPAFNAAIAAKADLVELDYYHSSDGIPFTFHDKFLDRTTNVNALLNRITKKPYPARYRKVIPTSSLALAQLKKLDAGLWKSKQFKGTKIPTLAESLDTIQKGSITLIERKQGDAATIVKLLESKQLIHDVVIQAFDWQYLADCHQLRPGLLLGALGSEKLDTTDIKEIERCGAQVVGWYHQDVTAPMVKLVHGKGWKLWVYTVNDPNEALRLVELGVDGIITDEPARIRNVLYPSK